MQTANAETDQRSVQPAIIKKANRASHSEPGQRKKFKAVRTTLFDLVAAVDREVPEQKDELVAQIVGHLLASRQIITRNARNIVIKR